MILKSLMTISSEQLHQGCGGYWCCSPQQLLCLPPQSQDSLGLLRRVLQQHQAGQVEQLHPHVGGGAQCDSAREVYEHFLQTGARDVVRKYQ